MKTFVDLADPRLATLLKQGAVGILPTDTIYGIVASVRNEAAIRRVYELKKRDANKASIILVGTREQIEDTAAWRAIDWHITKRYWPGPVSIVLPITDKTPSYLLRGTQSPPYRLPDHPKLRVLLNRVGPIIATSANLQGEPTATTVEEARAYFGDQVDFYVDGDQLSGKPSTLIEARGDKVSILRQGAGNIDLSDVA